MGEQHKGTSMEPSENHTPHSIHNHRGCCPIHRRCSSGAEGGVKAASPQHQTPRDKMGQRREGDNDTQTGMLPVI